MSFTPKQSVRGGLPSRVANASSPSGFRRDIQGLRAIAVGAVVLYHAGVPFLPGGYIGVDIFFVVSGFLITTHLLSEMRRNGRIGFANFYSRRARRILPASIVVIGLSVLAALIWYPPLLMREVWEGAVAAGLYGPNYLFAAQGTNYLAETTPSLFQHYWSLGVEEQFYLVWPLFLGVGFAIVKRPRSLFACVLGIVVISFAACVLLTYRSQPWAFFSLPTRAWELGVGGLVAFVLTYRPKILRGAAAAVVGWAGVIGIITTIVFFNSSTPFPSYWAACPVFATAAVLLAGDSTEQFGPSKALSLRAMTFVGLISYSLYLVHWPLLLIPQAAVGYEHPLPVWVTLLLGAISFPVAWLMYRFLETPGRKGAWLAAARPRRSLFAAAAASVAVALVATSIYSFSSSRLLYVNQAAPVGTVSSPPNPTTYVPSNMSPSLRNVSGDEPVIYNDGCHLDFAETQIGDCVYGDTKMPRIVLFGDSHAAQWFPAVLKYAQQNGFSVENRTKSSCPSVSANVLRDGVPYGACTKWRNAVIQKIEHESPALVLIANFGVASLASTHRKYSIAWGKGLSTTIAAIHAPVAVIADTPDLGATPSVCLSAHLASAMDCSRNRATALKSPARSAESSAAHSMGVPLIDMTNYLCGAAACAPILGNTLVYRDAHHITATFSGKMEPVLGRRLGIILRQLKR